MAWAESLLEGQRALAQFNGILQQTFMRAELRTMLRQIGSAGETAVRTEGLSDAYQDILDTLQPIRDSVTNVIAQHLTELLRIVNVGVHALKFVFDHAPGVFGGIGIGLKLLEFIEKNTRKEAMDRNIAFERFMDHVRQPVASTRVPDNL